MAPKFQKPPDLKRFMVCTVYCSNTAGCTLPQTIRVVVVVWLGGGMCRFFVLAVELCDGGGGLVVSLCSFILPTTAAACWFRLWSTSCGTDGWTGLLLCVLPDPYTSSSFQKKCAVRKTNDERAARKKQPKSRRDYCESSRQRVYPCFLLLVP